MDSTKKHKVEIEFSSDERRSMTRSIHVEEETALLYQILANEIDMDHSCGGSGSCGTCHYFVQDNPQNLSEILEVESDLRAERQFLGNERLACQSYVRGPVKIIIP